MSVTSRLGVAGVVALVGCTSPMVTRSETPEASVGSPAGTGAGTTTGTGTAYTYALRRLSRDEYVATVRDLFGDYGIVETDLPTDPLSNLFRNIGSAQSLARVDLEKYLRVAEGVVDRAWARRLGDPALNDTHFATRSTGVDDPFFGPGGALSLDSVTQVIEGAFALDVRHPGAVRVRVRVRPAVQPSGPIVVEVRQDDTVLASAEAVAPWPAGAIVDLVVDPAWRIMPGAVDTIRLAVGVHAGAGAPAVLVGLDGYAVSVQRDEQRFAACDTASETAGACLRRILPDVLRRAWRRPVASDEIDRLVALGESRVAAGAPIEMAVKTALAAVLVSSEFLFRVEAPASATASPRLDAHEYATRLSYTLWGSMPDAPLRASADSGALLADDEIRRQVARMVSDARFAGFVRNFAGQWLSFNGTASDPANAGATVVQPPYATESELFVASLFRANEPLSSLLASRWTYADSSLASVYGAAQILPPDHLVRVPLDSLPRRGYLTQASYLVATSHPHSDSSPTLRGLFILSRFFCDAPPPPPRIVADFANSPANDLSTRARLEAHRTDPQCSSCHEAMDPLGLAFEHYTSSGRWRDTQNNQPIDPSGTVDGLGSFADAMALVELLHDDARIAPCTVRHLMTYALGRSQLDSVATDLTRVRVAAGPDVRLLDLLTAVALSDAFRARPPVETP